MFKMKSPYIVFVLSALLFSPVATAISFPKLSVPKILSGEKSSDRDFSCASRCTDPEKVCGKSAESQSARDSCKKSCGAENKKKMLSKKDIYYDVNQYRYGIHGVMWGAIFEDVCAKPQRAFQIDNFNEYIAATYPLEIGFVAALAMEPEDVKFFANVAYLSYGARRPQLYSTYQGAGWDIEGFKGKTQIGSGHIAGVVMGKGNLVVIAFHGTESAGDAMTDMAFTRQSASPLGLTGSVHKGFLAAFISSWPEIKTLIKNYAAKNGHNVKDLEYITTGHSLGAALASVCAARIVTDSELVTENLNTRTNQVKAFTYASPRAFGTSAAADYHAKMGVSNTLRFWINGDPVPAVPQGTLGFKHVGVSIKIPGTTTTTGKLKDLVKKGLALNPKAHGGQYYVADAPGAFASQKVAPKEHLGMKSRLKKLLRF